MLKFISRLIIYSFILVLGFGVYEFYFFNKSLNQERQCVLVGKDNKTQPKNIKILGQYPYATANKIITAFIVTKKDAKMANQHGFATLKRELFCVPRHNLYALFNDLFIELVYPVTDHVWSQPKVAEAYLSSLASEMWDFLRQSFANLDVEQIKTKFFHREKTQDP